MRRRRLARRRDPCPPHPAAGRRHHHLQRREAAIALTEGARVSSSALFGFGLDSVIEVSSAAAVAWQFAARDPETREKAALRFIAFSFFALAAYITVDAVLLCSGSARPGPRRSASRSPRQASSSCRCCRCRSGGRAASWVRNRRSRIRQTLLCTYLSATLLVGLLLNSLLGWSWADPSRPW